MSEVTNGTKYVCLENKDIEIGGTKIPMFIEGEIEYTYTHHPAQNMQGRMEDATPSEEEIELNSVDLTVTLYGKSIEKCVEGNHGDIQFKTTCTEFYEEHFGELESCDVL
jgi:hypothetical protein